MDTLMDPPMEIIGNWYFLAKICKHLSAESILDLAKSCRGIYNLFKNNNSLVNYYYSASLLYFYQGHYFSQYDCLLDWGLGNVSFKEFFLNGHFNENHSLRFLKKEINEINFKSTLTDNFGISLIFYAILFWVEGKDFTDWEEDPSYLEDLEETFNKKDFSVANNNNNNFLNDYFYAMDDYYKYDDNNDDNIEDKVIYQILNDFIIMKIRNPSKQKSALAFLLEFEPTYRSYQKYSLYAELLLSILQLH